MTSPQVPPPRQSEPRMISAFASFTAIAAFLIAVVSVIVVVNKDTGGASSAASGTNAPIQVSLKEFSITPKTFTASPGKITFDIKNDGTMVHNLGVQSLGKVSPDIPAGGTGTLDLGTVPAGTYQVICEIPGHAAAGMTATLTVGGGGSGGESAQGGSAAASTNGANPDDATIDFSAKPPDTFTPRDPTAPPPLPGTVHDITFETRETELEVAPGVKQQMWTFNEEGQAPTVPGPILRGKIGDTFRVTLVNKGQMEHSIDFHASKVAWSNEMRSIKPGESLMYEFTANYAGAWMYHCGTAPALHHIGNGMYGAIIIDPPQLAPVDHEYVMVQSELYLGPQGQPGDLTKMQAFKPDAVVFNGYVNQYQFHPIDVGVDQRIRIWVIDDGPSENSSFHIVGTIFDTVFKEGSYLLQPDARRGGSQALDLQPAQGGFVEFTFAKEGYYVFLTHKFVNVGKGAMGLFMAGNPPPLGGGSAH